MHETAAWGHAAPDGELMDGVPEKNWHLNIFSFLVLPNGQN
jgi:hypothetical protein